MTNVKPLGAFGPRNRAEFDLDRATLLAQGTLDAPTREHVTAYLRSGTLVLGVKLNLIRAADCQPDVCFLGKELLRPGRGRPDTPDL